MAAAGRSNMVFRFRVLALLSALGTVSIVPVGRLAAAPASAGQIEATWDALKSAPVHVQAEVTSPAMGRFDGSWTSCASEAVVRTSFKGADLLPVGARFRLVGSCIRGTWYMTGGGAKVAAPQSDLTPGTLVEAVLVPFVTGNGSQVGTAVFRTQSDFGLERLSALSSSPKIDVSAKPSWLIDEGFRNTLNWDETWHSPRPEVPPHFPRRDVEVSYTVSSRPAETFLARWDAKMGRLAIQPSGSPPGASGRLVLDPVLDLTIRIFDDRRGFSIRSGSEGAALAGNASPQGEDEIAGTRCGKYRMTWTTQERLETRARSSDVCVTDDGVVLRRVEGGVTWTVTSVSYRPADPAATQVPAAYSRVPAEDDTKFVPRPVRID